MLLQRGETHLLTPQRVFLNSSFSQRAAYLREWAQILTPGGPMVVDVPHEIGLSTQLATHQNKRWDWLSTFALLSG